MPCHHCHNPGVIHRLRRVVCPYTGASRWQLEWMCLNPACVYEFRPWEPGPKQKGRPVYATPL